MTASTIEAAVVNSMRDDVAGNARRLSFAIRDAVDHCTTPAAAAAETALEIVYSIDRLTGPLNDLPSQLVLAAVREACLSVHDHGGELGPGKGDPEA